MAQCVVGLEGNEPCMHQVSGGTDYCAFHGQQFCADLEVFHEISEHFRMDVREYWSRSNFYLLVQGALISVFVGIVRDNDSLGGLSVIVGVFGLLLCVFWMLVAWENVRWIERWRNERILMDKRIDRHASIGKVEGKRSWISSPEKATRFIPWLFAAGGVSPGLGRAAGPGAASPSPSKN